MTTITGRIARQEHADLEPQNRPGLSTRDFENAYNEFKRPVFAYAARRVGPDRAEDITQSTFIELWTIRDRFDPSLGSVRTLLFGIAVKLIAHHKRDEIRSYKALERTGVDLVDPFDEIEVINRATASQHDRLVAAALAEMRDEYRDVVTLAKWAELSYLEIAVALDIPIGTVSTWVRRATEQIRTHLARQGVSATVLHE